MANRTAEIQRLLPQADRHHVASKENPADLGFRGVSCQELLNSSLWLSGPAFLHDPNETWNGDVESLPASKCPDHRPTACVVTQTLRDESELLTKYSTLENLLRITSRCFQFIHALKKRLTVKSNSKPIRGQIAELKPAQLRPSLTFWIKYVQTMHYKDDIRGLTRQQPVPTRSSLSRLNPFVDEHGCLRVGGHLQHALLHPDEKHPLILPRNSHLSSLLAKDAHKKTMHRGTQLSLSYLRQRFWILSGRQLVKGIVFRWEIYHQLECNSADPSCTLALIMLDQLV